MKKINTLIATFTIMILTPFYTFADHLDVIQVELEENCGFNQYLAIAEDFNNNWAKEYDYKVEILIPVQSNDLKSIFWVGRSSDAVAFGKAWEAWVSDLGKSDSVASILSGRFDKCGNNMSRRSYGAY
ncbi:MAG: hypothetical protein ACI9MS_000267 [Glaciecola sp.]|jgi:hypothetical protein|tara:strand:+ start:97 stop:480 length:384 start_codon:yes stop_codon:yes gene_type:complete